MAKRNFLEGVTMQCQRCKGVVVEGEARTLHGQTLCEDCYMDLLSPLKACDPWAVHSAKNLINGQTQAVHLSQIQRKILDVLRDKGALEPKILAGLFSMKEAEIERELATLRHMELVRGELRHGKRVIRLW